jgi:GPH family glycoside/pentoside/hexuronide:cation symporter
MGTQAALMFVAALLVALFFIMLFSVPVGDPDARYWYVMLTFIAGTIVYTIFMVPYVTMTSEIAEDYNDCTVINGYRMTFAMTGVLIGGACVPMLIEYGGGGREGYQFMEQVLGAIMMLVMLITFFSGKEPEIKNPKPIEVKELRGLFANNAAFLILLGAYVMQ